MLKKFSPILFLMFCFLPKLSAAPLNPNNISIPEESKLFAQIVIDEEFEEIKAFKTCSQLETEPSLAESKINAGQELAFGDFVHLLLRNHPDIIAADLNRKIASSKRLEAQGAFDPSINSRNFFYRFNSSSAVGDTQETFTSNTSLDFLTGYGAKFGLGAKFAQGDIKTPISPTGEAGEYFIKAQIPLLRGAIYNSKFVKEKSSRLYETIADFKLFMTKLKTIDYGVKAYWDWVVSQKTLNIESNLLNLVNGQLAFVDQQSQLGNLPKIAIIEAGRELQKRRTKVNKALRSVQASSLNLAQFTWTDNGQPYAVLNSKQVPQNISLPEALEQSHIEVAKLNCLKQRPEFQALDLSRQISDLERKLAKNQMLPLLDAYVMTGVETGDESIGPSVEAGFDISIPLRLRTAKGRKQQAELEIQKLNLQERQLVQNVFLEVEDAASAVQTSYLRYLAASKDYELSKKLEQAEKDKFELGSSTLFLVIRRQRATVEANIELIKTIADYHKSKYRFKLVQGELI